MRTFVCFSILALAAGCSHTDNSEPMDAALDFALPAQSTLVGVRTNTCCLVTYGPRYALYLANPQPGTTDQNGFSHPATGDLHLTNPWGADYQLATGVPAYDYAFTPDGQYAMFAAPSKNNFALDFATLEHPELKTPTITTVIPDGIQDLSFFQQSFFSPSGNYLIIGVLPGTIMNSPDLHVVDVHGAKDVYQLGDGAFSYLELFAPDETMVFENSTASTQPGVPSVEGLYVGNLPALIGGSQPSLLDTHVGEASLMADGSTLLYVRTDTDELRMYDLANKYTAKIGDQVASFSTGADRRGPIVWIGTDRSLHVAPKLGPELLALPPDSIDIFSPIVFSPDGLWLYYFKNLSQQDSNGDLYAVKLPPAGSGTPKLVGQHISSVDLSFVNGRMLLVRNVDATGATGDAVSAAYDGSDMQPIASGVSLGGILTAFPTPITPSKNRTNYTGPLDLGTPSYPPILANLTGATANPMQKPLNDGSLVVGALAFGPMQGGVEHLLDGAVHAGVLEFSDDGYVLAYAGGAAWNDNITDYTGTLHLSPTVPNEGSIVEPKLDGVSELGPIFNRQLFVNAPAAADPGVYFVRY